MIAEEASPRTTRAGTDAPSVCPAKRANAFPVPQCVCGKKRRKKIGGRASCGPPLCETSEGNILVADRTGRGRLGFGRALIETIVPLARSAGEITSTFAASTEQHQIIHDDFRHVFFLVGLLVFPGVRPQAAFDIH